MTRGPERLPEGDLDDALWRLLSASDRDDPAAFTAEHDRAAATLDAATDPRWTAWRHALAARRGLVDGDPEAVAAEVSAAREALAYCLPSAQTALTLAHLAHVEVAADHADTGMVLAIDASLLAETATADGPSRPLHQAHLWLSLTLAALDLEELAVAQALQGSRVADELPGRPDRWRLLQLSAQQHAELAHTLHRRGQDERARELAGTAVDCAEAARSLDWEPAPVDQDLLDVVQAWAIAGRGEVEEALGPLRRAHRRVHRDGGTWLRGYADLVLARLLTRLARDRSGGGHDAEATDLLVDAAGAFAAAGDRRRYRQCLLELGQGTAAMGRPAEALHWLEAYRADTGRAHARGRELWADPLRATVRTTATGDRALHAAALLALGRALRRQGDGGGADEQLAQALAAATEHGLPRLRRAALRELCTLHAELDDAGRALPYLQAYLADELDRVDERRTRWVELFGRRKSLLETERAAGQLRRQAYEDPLTHLPNRRYAEATLDGLLGSGAAPALAVVDVDRFKEVNDAVGHAGGDDVLRRVAEILVAGCRDTDDVCRWAGDEFVVLLPDTTAEQAERALERCRRAVAETDWAALGMPVPVTISVGVASATRGDDRRTLFAAADGVLYDAKRSGRDRVVRLSAVTQTRAVDGPPDALPGPAGAAVTDGSSGDDTAPTGSPGLVAPAPRVPAVQPSPLTDPTAVTSGFAPLLVEPADPPLGLGSPAEPALAPAPPTAAPALEPPVPPAAPARGAPAEPDVIWAPGRSTEQVLALVREARRQFPDRPAVVVRAPAETLVALASEHDAYTTVDAASMSAAVGPLPEPVGRIGVLCGVGGDLAVAAEAAFAARVTGTAVLRVDDVGGSRFRSGLPGDALPEDVECLVVVAGLDASLAGLLGVLTDVPIVAVPISTGQPGSFGGFSALLTMLNSASPGVVVSNIDNGHAAGVFAARIARRARR